MISTYHIMHKPNNGAPKPRGGLLNDPRHTTLSCDLSCYWRRRDAARRPATTVKSHVDSPSEEKKTSIYQELMSMKAGHDFIHENQFGDYGEIVKQQKAPRAPRRRTVSAQQHHMFYGIHEDPHIRRELVQCYGPLDRKQVMFSSPSPVGVRLNEKIISWWPYRNLRVLHTCLPAVFS